MITLSCEYFNMPWILEHIKVAGPIWDVLRELGWSLIVAFCKILDGVYDGISFLMGINFYNDIPAVKAFVDLVNPIVWAVFGLALIFGAIYLMVNHDKLKISEFLKSIMLSCVLIIALPFTMENLSGLLNAGVSDMGNMIEEEDSTIGQTILKGITVDIDASQSELTNVTYNPYMLDINDKLSNNGVWSYKIINSTLSDERINSAYMNSSTRSILKITKAEYRKLMNISDYEELAKYELKLIKLIAIRLNNPSLMSCTTLAEVKEVYYEEFHETEELIQSFDGKYSFKKLEDAEPEMTDPSTWFYPEHLYAYDFSFVLGFLLIIVSIIAMTFAAMKIVGLLFDLVFNQMIAPIVFASDLHNTGRSKKLIQNIVSTYLVFIIILVLVKLYLDINIWVIQQNWPIVVQLIILIGTAKSLIDGPDIVVKLLGIDAGVKSGMAAMMGVQTAGRMASSGVKTAKSAVKTAGRMAKTGVNMSNSAGNTTGRTVAKLMRGNTSSNNEPKSDRNSPESSSSGGGNGSSGTGDNSSSSSPSEKNAELSGGTTPTSESSNPIEKSEANGLSQGSNNSGSRSSESSNPVAQANSSRSSSAVATMERPESAETSNSSSGSNAQNNSSISNENSNPIARAESNRTSSSGSNAQSNSSVSNENSNPIARAESSHSSPSTPKTQSNSSVSKAERQNPPKSTSTAKAEKQEEPIKAKHNNDSVSFYKNDTNNN